MPAEAAPAESHGHGRHAHSHSIDLEQVKLKGGVGQWVSTHVVGKKPVYHHPSSESMHFPGGDEQGHPAAFLVTHRTARASDAVTTLSFWEQDPKIIEKHMKVIEDLEVKRLNAEEEVRQELEKQKQRKHDEILHEFHERYKRNHNEKTQPLPRSQRFRNGNPLDLEQTGGGVVLSPRNYNPPMKITARMEVERELRVALAPVKKPNIDHGMTVEEDMAELDEFEIRLKELSEISLEDRLKARLGPGEESKPATPRKGASPRKGQPVAAGGGVEGGAEAGSNSKEGTGKSVNFGP